MGPLAVVGCSFTSGAGLSAEFPNEDCKDSPDLWVNLCYNNIDCFSNLKLINLSKGGASNADIFEQALEVISLYPDLEYLMCAWTAMPRYNFEVGFELYTTKTKLFQSETGRHELNDKTVTANYQRSISDRLLTLIHVQGEIVKLVKYINIIKRLAKNTKVVNINALCPWDNNFFNRRTDNFLPSDLSKFTQNEILNIKNRDDEEIYKLYNLQHNQYDNAGGINSTSWANLYNSFFNLQLDTNYDNSHPGKLSNQKFYEVIKTYITANIAV